MMKKLGVIGGLGPAATAYFYELFVKMCSASTDQGHPEVIIYSRPSIPDRTAYILNKSKENPAIPMIEIAKTLSELGVNYIALPCVTAHYFYDSLSESVNIPIINIIRETADYLKKNNIRHIGLMTTDGTIASRIFHNELEKYVIQISVPTPEAQSFIMNLVYSIKANSLLGQAELGKFKAISDELRGHGSVAILLACTELSLLKCNYGLGDDFIDVLEILASSSLRLCL